MKNTTTLALLLLAAAAASAVEEVIPQRRNDIERRFGVLNAPGETTYAVDEDARRAVFTVGTTEAGDLVVGDPYAIHFAPTRLLAADEWALSFGTNVCYGEHGEIMFSTEADVYDWPTGEVRTATILPARPDLALSGCTFRFGGSGFVRSTVADDGIVLSASHGLFPPTPGGVAEPHPLCVSNLVVYAFAGPARSETFDATMDKVTLVDTVGAVPLSDLRAWVLRTYEDRAAEDWSRYPAVSRVALAGNRIEFNSAGNVFLGMEADSGTNAVRFVLNASPVLSLVPGLSGASDALRIWRFAIEGDEAACYVASDLGAPVGLHVTADLREPFVRAQGESSSYPATTNVVDGAGVTHACYRVAMPVENNARAAFFRAYSTGAAGTGNQLRIENCDLWIDGIKFARETWTFALTNGTTVTRTVLVGDAQ